MGLNRRQFIKISSVATAGLSFAGLECVNAATNRLTADELYRAFSNPENGARPFVRWWWNGNLLTRQELLRELDLLKEAGIGGVEINPIKIPEEDDTMGITPCDWLCPEWNALLKTALEGARDRGMTCDTIVGSGWPFGGEFLSEEEQIQMIAVGMRELTGPGRFRINKSELVNEVEPDIHSKYEKKKKELFMLRLAPGHMPVFEPGRDLNDQLGEDIITIDVPEGTHILYYLVKFTGYMAVINGAPGAKGPVLNHYNAQAVQKYLDRMSDTLAGDGISLHKYFRAMFVDSFELEGANWCQDLFEQFEQRRSYSLIPYFPYILFKIGHMGNPIKGEYGSRYDAPVHELIQRVRYDFECTLIELFHERFILTFQKWCNKWGVRSRMQAYGRGCHPLESSMAIDIPECETWLGPSLGKSMPEFDHRSGRAYTMINKFVSSGARLAGKKLVSCEELTNVGMVFNDSLNHFKIAGDLSNLSGVTHSILHGFNYSPREAAFPGWIRYGVFLNERNTWWPYFRNWADYKARVSAVFQKADLYAHIAVLHPLADMWMQFGSQRDPFPTEVYPEYAHALWEAIHQNGNSCDYISEKIIQAAVAEDGFLKYNTRSYKVLLLMEVVSMEPRTAEALKRFTEAGGLLLFIGKEPARSPGFFSYRENDEKVSDIIRTLKKEHPERAVLVEAPVKNISGWFAALQRRFNLDQAISFDKPVASVSQVHYKYGDTDIFFIINSSATDPHRLKAVFNHVKGRYPQLWNPEDGSRSAYSFKGMPNELTIDLGPADSRLIIFADRRSGKDQLSGTYVAESDGPASGKERLRETNVAEDKRAVDPFVLKGPWDVSLQPVNGDTTTALFPELIDFKEDTRLRSFAGTVLYRTTILIKDPSAFTYLDLGAINGVSEVMLNGSPLGKKWYGRHKYAVKSSLLKGENKIEIKIVTLLGNYVKSLKDNKVAQAWTKNQPLYPAGLIGPVKLM